MSGRCAPAFAFVAFMALAIALAPVAKAHGEGAELFEGAEMIIMPYTDGPPDIDGQIGSGEYSTYGEWTEEGFELFLEHNDSSIFVGIRPPGPGWVGVALSGDIEAGANVIVATVNATAVEISDRFAANITDEMDSEPDTEIGGASDILAFGAFASSSRATYEFAILLDSPDPRDQRLETGSIYPLVVAFNETATELPMALGEGDIHFLRVYVARAGDRLAAIRELFRGETSPIPTLAAMAVFSATTGALVWRFLARKREEER